MIDSGTPKKILISSVMKNFTDVRDAIQKLGKNPKRLLLD